MGEKCLRELESQHSEHVISGHSKKNNEKTKINRYIPDPLVKAVDGLMSEWKDLQVIDKIDVKNMVPPEEARVPVVELRFLASIIICMGQRFIKVMFKKKLNNTKKIQYFKKHEYSFYLGFFMAECILYADYKRRQLKRLANKTFHISLKETTAKTVFNPMAEFSWNAIT